MKLYLKGINALSVIGDAWWIELENKLIVCAPCHVLICFNNINHAMQEKES